MNNHRKKINLNIDVNRLDDHVCLKCGGSVFSAGTKLKKCSALQSPTGKPTYIPIPVFCCAMCKEVVPPVPVWNNQKADS